MTIQVGDRLPEATFMTFTPDGPAPKTTDDIFNGKTVALFAVPGAFTPTCSAKHLPGFVQHAADIKAKGVDLIACVSVNDVFVMKAWGLDQGVGDDVLMLADGNGRLHRQDRPDAGRLQVRHGLALAALFHDRQGRGGRQPERRGRQRIPRVGGRLHAEKPLSEAVLRAAQALKAGGLVLMPTETVYGLAADAADPAAVAAIFEAKGRPRFNPLIAHVTGLAAARRFAALDNRATRLAQAFWPGPLTIVAPIVDEAAVCDLARAGLDTVAVRAPAHPDAQALLEAFGGPVCAPSANRSGRPSPTTLDAALDETGASAAAWIDGGACAVGLESTVVAVLDGPVRLLRPGGLAREAIEAVVGPLAEADDDARRSPGRLARHYAPEAKVRLNAAFAGPGEAFLRFGDGIDDALSLSPSGDVREAAQRLFSVLRAADRLGPAAIAVAPVPEIGLGEAVNDRLRRAAGFVG